jgi:hypothetical protein
MVTQHNFALATKSSIKSSNPHPTYPTLSSTTQLTPSTHPQTTIHAYQITSPHTEFLGLIIPGGWGAFFRFIGEPYTGALFPTHDPRHPSKP